MQSELQRAWADFEKSRDDLRRDIPGFVNVIDKHEALVRLRLDVVERRIQLHQAERELVIKAGVMAAGIAVLFPPFHWGARGSSFGLGHSFILLPPKVSPVSSDSSYGAIDAAGLIAILAGIALVTWGATLVQWKK